MDSQDFPVEVSVEFASKHLGVTERTVTNYLKSNQLKGEKVGSKWFIDSESLKTFRGQRQPLSEVKLPTLENPLSENQEKKVKGRALKSWEFKKGTKRHPGKLHSYRYLEESFNLLVRIREEISEEYFDFFHEEVLLLGDDLSAGYYSFGPVKRKLYGRARIRSGRLVSRAIFYGLPEGFLLSLFPIVESISFLCRRMDK